MRNNPIFAIKGNKKALQSWNRRTSGPLIKKRFASQGVSRRIERTMLSHSSFLSAYQHFGPLSFFLSFSLPHSHTDITTHTKFILSLNDLSAQAETDEKKNVSCNLKKESTYYYTLGECELEDTMSLSFSLSPGLLEPRKIQSINKVHPCASDSTTFPFFPLLW